MKVNLQWLTVPGFLYGSWLLLGGILIWLKNINGVDIAPMIGWGALYDYGGRGLSILILWAITYFALRNCTITLESK